MKKEEIHRLTAIIVAVICIMGLQGGYKMVRRTTESVACDRPATGVNGTMELNYQPRMWAKGERPSWESMKEEGRRPLNFLHIPKTGGSSITNLAAKNGLKWGGCVFPSKWGKGMCPNYSTTNQNYPKHPYSSAWWHTPVQYLHPDQPNPYDGFDLFAVARNPYERAVSEYYYHCKFHKIVCFGPKHNQDTAERLNYNLQSKLRRVFLADKNSEDYFLREGHWIPQYDYFYNEQGERVVTHLLHNERLHAEFDSLMKSYGLNMTLPQAHKKSRTDLGAKQGVENLSLATLKLIEVVFERDFALGGYEMLSGQVAAATLRR